MEKEKELRSKIDIDKTIGVGKSTIGWLKDTKRSGKVFATTSSFAMAIGIYVVAQGLRQGFSADLWNLSTLVVGFAGGLGIPAVQEDGIRKAVVRFITENELFKRYRKENIDMSDEIKSKDFQRYFVNKENENELAVLQAKENDRQTELIKDKIFSIESSLFLIKKDKKRTKEENKLVILKKRLKDIEGNGVDLRLLKIKPIRVGDVFNFSNETTLTGQDNFIDNSVTKQRKSNLLARFYMPAIMMILLGFSTAVLGENKGDVLGSTIIFLLILIYTWYRSYTKQGEFKELIAVPAEKNRNTALKQATEEYKTWTIKSNAGIENEVKVKLDYPLEIVNDVV